MTAYVEELLVEALIAAPGCPEPMVERLLRSAMVDFYRDTRAWRYTTEVASVIRGDREVELETPTGTTVGRVYWAKLAGKLLKPLPQRDLRDDTGTPTGFAIEGLSRIVQLNVKPERSYIADGVVAALALQPLHSLDELPDELFALHRDGILYGALAKLLAMPNVAWGSLNDASTYAGMAAGVKLNAQRQADSQQAPVVRTVRYGGL